MTAATISREQAAPDLTDGATRFYMLTTRDEVTVGDVLPNRNPDTAHDYDYYPVAKTSCPRRLNFRNMLPALDEDDQIDLSMCVDATGPTPRLAIVRPNGPVRPHSAVYTMTADERAAFDVTDDADMALEADGGWTITWIGPFTPVLGPQGEHIVAAIRKGIPVLLDETDETEPVREAYNAATSAQEDSPRAYRAAIDALLAIGVDGYWWDGNLPCTWGFEMLALAARDLCGTVPDVPDWNVDAYNELTWAWRSSFPTPLHPDDPELVPGKVHAAPAAIPAAVTAALDHIDENAEDDGEVDEVAKLAADLVLLAEHDGVPYVLMIVRDRPPFEGCLALPGGHLNPGEDDLDAAIREGAEETGVDVAELAERIEFIGTFRAPGRDPRRRYVSFAWMVVLDELVHTKAGSDARIAAWVPVEIVLAHPELVGFDHHRMTALAMSLRFGDRDALAQRGAV